MPDLDLLTEIHTDVKYIKEKLAAHIDDDEEIKKNLIFPMWNAHQQAIGRQALWLLLLSAVSAISGYISGGVHK